MNDLIKINYESDNPTISARDLHENLRIEKRFSVWFETNSAGFAEGEEYTPYLWVHPQNKQEFTDYHLTTDMAKHICLMSRTEKGKQCRQQLIDLEKAWNTPEQVMARAIKMANQKIDDLKSHNTILIADVQRMKPKEIFADAVSVSHTTILIGELAKLIKQNGVDMGEKRLFVWLRESGYLIKRKGTDYNSPTQKSMELELFTVKETSITHADGHVTVNKTTKVTGKGQQYFINKFLAEKQA